jgi:hypothetical protein
VKLGIHDVGLDPEKPSPTITTTRTTRTTIRTATGTTTTSIRTATSTRAASLPEIKKAGHARLLEYLHDMGIDKELLTAASAIPYESVRFLERDELVRFGIDRREFGEMAFVSATSLRLQWSRDSFPPSAVGIDPVFATTS